MPLRGADRTLTSVEEARPRVIPMLATIAGLALAVVYLVPLVTTGDPLWPLPTMTEADTIVVYWDGARTEIGRVDARYPALMAALNEALSAPVGIEYQYGISEDAVSRLRREGRALEALYRVRARTRGAYALGDFTRLLVALDGEEYERRLIFVGDEPGYRGGPLRTRDLGRLRGLAEAAR